MVSQTTANDARRVDTVSGDCSLYSSTHIVLSFRRIENFTVIFVGVPAASIKQLRTLYGSKVMEVSLGG